MIAETIRNIIALREQPTQDPYQQMLIQEAIREAETAISAYDMDDDDPDIESYLILLHKNTVLEKLILKFDKTAT